MLLVRSLSSTVASSYTFYIWWGNMGGLWCILRGIIRSSPDLAPGCCISWKEPLAKIQSKDVPDQLLGIRWVLWDDSFEVDLISWSTSYKGKNSWSFSHATKPGSYTGRLRKIVETTLPLCVAAKHDENTSQVLHHLQSHSPRFAHWWNSLGLHTHQLHRLTEFFTGGTCLAWSMTVYTEIIGVLLNGTRMT